MIRICVILVCMILAGCADRHTAMKPQQAFAPKVARKGNHIWIKPGTNSTHFEIGKVRQW